MPLNSYEIRLRPHLTARLRLEILHEGNIREFHDYPYDQGDSEQIGYWIIASLKNLLYHDEFAELTISVSTDPSPSGDASAAQLSQIAQMMTVLILRTQAFIKQYAPLSERFRSFSGHLFYNVDELNTFRELYDKVSPRLQNVHYQNFLSGWDKVQRTWGKGVGFDVDGLIRFLVENEVNRLVCVNMYYVNHLMQTEFILPLPLFKALGLEWVTLDYDTYEFGSAGLIQKSAHHCPFFRRFSIMPTLASRLDRLYGNENIRYFMIGGGDVPETPPPAPLGPVTANIISQARLQNLIQDLPAALFFLEMTDPERPYHDFQMFYYALLKILFNDPDLERGLKERLFILLSLVHMNVLSFLKYDVIQTLIDHRIPTRLYGDTQWEPLFPSVYQRRFLDEGEMTEIFRAPGQVYLLLNQNYSYLENNPAFLRAFGLNAPYLCFPSVVTTPDLEGLRCSEYKTPRELVEKLGKLDVAMRDPSFQSSLKNLKTKIAESREDFFRLLSDSENRAPGRFGSLCREHEALHDADLGPYLASHKDRLIFFYRILKERRLNAFNMTQSRYRHRPFFPLLYRAYEENVVKTRAKSSISPTASDAAG